MSSANDSAAESNERIDSIGDETVEDIFILEKSKRNFDIKKINKNSKLHIWEHFGQIVYKSGGIITDRKYTEKIFCIPCFHSAPEQKPIFKAYSKSTSATVLSAHLANEHDIAKPAEILQRKQRTLDKLYGSGSVIPLPNAKKLKNKELSSFLLNRSICIWFCRDLLPFSMVENVGFTDFWDDNFKHSDALPSRSTVSREALDDVYVYMKEKLVNDLKNASKHGAITFDAWTDRFSKHSYITYTYHYMHEWTMKSTILKTSHFDRPHTAESLKENFLSTVAEYSIDDKHLIGITDGGSNMIKCLEILNIKRIGCLAHSCNRLIVHDLLKNEKMKPFLEIFTKLKTSQRKLRFKYTELKQRAEEDRQSKLYSMIEQLSDLDRACELENRYLDDAVYHELEEEFSKELEKSNSNFYGLYSSSPVRWNCLYNTIECNLRHQDIIRTTLESLKCYDLIMNLGEIKLLEGLAAVLKPFNDFTEIIQGIEYPTINLIPILITDIEYNLTAQRMFATEDIIVEGIDILLTNLRKRIELSEIVVAAACLDPAIQHATIINEWFHQKGISRADLIRKVAKDLKIELPDTARFDNQVANQHTHNVSENNSNTKNNNALASSSKLASKLSNLIEKHTSPCTQALNTIENELSSFKNVDKEDALQFWSHNHKNYPKLSAVAAVILAFVISNAKSESAFSISGCLIRDKRSSIQPFRAEKVLFVHDNYHLLNTASNRQSKRKSI